MKIINKILCNTVHAICATADFIGVVVATVIKWAIFSALGLASMVAAFFLWLSIPCGICRVIFGEFDEPITSQWELFAVFGIFAVWVVITKIAYDRWDRRRNKTPLEKFFEDFNKRA